MLEGHLGALAKRLDELTKHQHLNLREAAQRLRFPAIAARSAGAAFSTMASATLKLQKLWLEYHARSTDEVTERTVSPQRIVHYREARYLDACDEDKDALRSFSIDRIRRAMEQWHPHQQGRWLEDWSYELSIPYRESRELVMDVMRQGADVEVRAPAELKRVVSEQPQAAAAQYV